MGKQSRAKRKGLNLEEQRIINYLDKDFYPEITDGTQIYYDVRLRANVRNAYSKIVETSEFMVDPFWMDLGGYCLYIQQVDDTSYVIDVMIAQDVKGRVAIHFNDELELNWDERGIIDSNNFLASQLPRKIEDFISLPCINEVAIYSILAVNKKLYKEVKKKSEEPVKRENFEIKVEKKEESNKKNPEYTKESWKVGGYKRKDGTNVSGYESTRNPNLLNKKASNQ